MRGLVLHNVHEPGADKKGTALGSLSAHLGTTFDGEFDVIVSNPPWRSVDEAHRFAKQYSPASVRR